MNDGGADRGAMAAIAPVDILDHFLAALMFEIDIDVGRLAARLRDEASEEKLRLVGIDLGDAEAITHRAIGGGTAALAENAAFTRIGDNVVNGEEVTREVELLDDGEFVLQARDDIVGNA